jgi:hypothetical protein
VAEVAVMVVLLLVVRLHQLYRVALLIKIIAVVRVEQEHTALQDIRVLVDNVYVNLVALMLQVFLAVNR